MANEIFLTTTYVTSLFSRRSEGKFLKVGFCLSNADLNDLTSAYPLFLHPQERLYLNNLQHSKRQASYLLGRYCAKQALAIYYLNPMDLTSICIEHGVFQQPVVHHPSYHKVQVSISHTDTLGAAIAFAETHPMAIDIETVCARKIEALKTQLTKAELELAADNTVCLIVLWTAKEALSKALKCGLMVDFKLLEINTLIPSGQFTISYFKHFYQYQARSFLLAGSICTLVYPRKTQLQLDISAIQQLFGID